MVWKPISQKPVSNLPNHAVFTLVYLSVGYLSSFIFLQIIIIIYLLVWGG